MNWVKRSGLRFSVEFVTIGMLQRRFSNSILKGFVCWNAKLFSGVANVVIFDGACDSVVAAAEVTKEWMDAVPQWS
jgi:hypothetical protein